MIKRSINLKLLSGIITVLVISMLLIGVIFIKLYSSYIIESKKESLISRSKQASSIVYSIEQSGYPVTSYGRIFTLIGEASDSHMWIVDKSGAIYSFTSHPSFDSFSDRKPREYDERNSYERFEIPREAAEISSAIMRGNESVTTRYSQSLGETVITVGMPIKDSSGAVMGGVILNSSVKGISDIVDKAQFLLLTGILVAIIVAIVISTIFSGFITKPIKAMNRLALSMANGEYDKLIEVKQSDEIGQLGESLNTLSANLKATIDQLHLEKAKLSDIITSISEGIFSTDAELKISSFNASLLDLLGIGNSDDAERSISRFTSDNGIDRLMEAVIKGDDVSPTLIEISGRHLMFSFSPLMSIRREHEGCVVLVQDVSESERLEQMRRDFVANVSHEFKTPLTVIRGTAEAVRDGAFSSEESVSRAYSRIIEETKHLDRLVMDLLDLSRLEAGKLELKDEKLDLLEVADSVARSMAIVAGDRHMDIRLETELDEAPYTGDFDRLKQLLVIFSDNAIKYSPENTDVVISVTRSHEGSYELRVRDQGFGIAAEDLPHIFDRFYKSDKSRTRTKAANCSGLGLSIAKLLCDSFGALLSIDSEPDKGTSVTVTLPKKDV